MIKSVFVTVGTTKFDKLIEIISTDKILKLLKNKGYNKIVIQIGNGKDVLFNGRKFGLDIEVYRFKNCIEEDIAESTLIISHAGAGTCLEVLEKRKPLIVVVNEDLMNNHQAELAEQLYKNGHLLYCTPFTLNETLQNNKISSLIPFNKGNVDVFIKYLDICLGFKV